MKNFRYILPIILTILFTACGGGSSDNSNDTTTGVAVDNYIKNATVCIDTNKNNLCSDESPENITTTDENGVFSFPKLLNNDDVIIAYDGKDIKTLESFPYILKNIASNKDSNNKIVLSSLTTLTTDYMLETHSSLSTAKTAIANFLGGSGENIDTNILSEDIIAKRDTQTEEFLKSLKIFQMVKVINDNNNTSLQSANSFKALAKTISSNPTLTDSSATIQVETDNNQTFDINQSSFTPVLLSTPTNSFLEGLTSPITTLDAVDPNAHPISYSIVDGADSSLFTISDNKIYFKNTPNYALPQDSDQNNIYTLDINISNGITSEIKTITVNVQTTSTVPPTLTDTTLATISSTQTPLGSYIGATSITNPGDSAIILYEISSNAYFDINTTTGNIILENNVSALDNTRATVTVKAKNSAGWSNEATVTIPVVNGDVNTTKYNTRDI